MMKHWIIHVVLVFAGAVLGFLLYAQAAIQKESNASAGRALAQLAEWVKAGEAGLVCHAVTNAHEILSESGFNGMSFEKIMWMTESDMKKSEPAPGSVPSKAAEDGDL